MKKSPWGILWRKDSQHRGRGEHLCYARGLPMLYRTRREARIAIEEGWGYIRRRPDLRAEPFGWKMPVAVRVTVEKET